MHKFLKLSALFIFVLGICMLFACSDDKGSGSGTKTQGSMDDPQFQAMQSQIEEDMEIILSSISFGTDNFDEFDTDFSDNLGGMDFGGFTGDDFNLSGSYVYQNGWHIFTMQYDTSITEEGSTVDVNVDMADSIQFRNNNTVVQNPDENTDYLHFKFLVEMLLDLQSEGTTLTYNIDNYRINNEYQKLGNGTVQVDGIIEIDYDLAMEYDTFDISGGINYDMEIDELIVDETDGCPMSGVITASISESLSGNQGSGSVSWSMTLTFLSSTQYRVRFESGSNYWEYTDTFDCDNDVAASAIPMPKSVAKKFKK